MTYNLIIEGCECISRSIKKGFLFYIEKKNNIEYYTDPFDENNEKYVEEKSILNAYPYEKIR